MKKMFFAGVLIGSILRVQGADEAVQCNNFKKIDESLAYEKLNGLYNTLKKEFAGLKNDNCDLVQQKQDCVKLVDKAHLQLEKLSDEISHFCVDCEKVIGLDSDIRLDIPDEYIQAKSQLRNNRELLRTLFLVSLYRQFTQKHVDDIQRKDRKFKLAALVGGTFLGSVGMWFLAH